MILEKFYQTFMEGVTLLLCKSFEKKKKDKTRQLIL